MKNRYKYSPLCFLLLFCKGASAEVSTYVLCLSSFDSKRINFEMRIYSDRSAKWKTGFVKYQGSKTPIPVFLKNSVEEVLSEDAPYQHTNTWIEVANEKISGMYEISMQGTQVPSAVYESFSSRKKFHFVLNNSIEGTPETGCLWE